MRTTILATVSLLVCVSCVSSTPSTEFSQAIKAGLAEGDRVSQLDPRQFRVQVSQEDSMVRYSRCGKTVLVQDPDNRDVYVIMGPRGTVGMIVVGKSWSPRITVMPNCPLAYVVESKGEGSVLLRFFDIEAGYVEGYIVNRRSVTLIDEEQYVRELAEIRGGRAFVEVYVDSVIQSVDGEEPAQK